MPKPNDKKPEFDENKWNEAVAKGASLNRWDAELMGPAMENYRDHIGAAEQRQFLEDLPSIMTHGRRLSDYRAAVDNKTTEEAEQAVWFDQTQFYKEVQAAIHPKREPSKIAMVDPHFPLKQESGEPVYVQSPGIAEKFIDWLFKKKMPKEVRKLGDEKKLQETLREIYEHYDQIEELNAEIFLMKNNLSALEQKLVENEGTDAEARIRSTITKQQNAIRENMAERAKILEEKTNPKEVLSIELMKAVRKVLKEESKKINDKFGTQIAKLFRDRQVLINQTTMTGHESPDSLIKKLELQAKIEQIDIKLNELKDELIEYKSERPIFLFERLVGVQSIPMVYRLGQKSTLDFSFEKERESWSY